MLTDLKTGRLTHKEDYRKVFWISDEILNTIFYIETEKTELSASEKKIIGPLIDDVLHLIGYWVFCADYMHPGNVEDFKHPRSGLQFLLDKYQELQDKDGNCLRDAFETFKEDEDIGVWDDTFKRMIEPGYSDEALFI